MAMVVSRLCVDFWCQASVTVALLPIVQGWLKWVKMETWSHNGHCLVCKMLAFFLGIPDVNCSGSQNSEHTRLPRNVIAELHTRHFALHVGGAP